jgi:AraC family transcriptional regulator of adaptative response/methylated-DNA-[protein]-cysteine methyltransferase
MTEEIRVEIGHSSLGLVLVAVSAKGIRAVQLGDDSSALRRELSERFPNVKLTDPDSSTSVLADKVIDFVESEVGTLDAPLDIRGTDFQRAVWEELREIPPGSTISYTELAARVGKPNAVRAVAHACAENPLAVIVPCHRAVRSDGSLAGYRWGLDRKRALLSREASPVLTGN